MRHLRIMLGLAAMVCVLGIGTAAASAHEFTASKAGKTKGLTEEEEHFKFGPFKVTCLKAATTGAVAESQVPTSNTFFTSAKFKKCSTLAKIGNHPIEIATTFKTPIDIEYLANGTVEEIGSEGEEVDGVAEVSGGEIELKVNAGPKFKCVIYLPAQKIKAKKNVETAVFAPALSKNLKFKALKIENNFKAMEFVLEGEPCDEWAKEEGPEGKVGIYEGNLNEELAMGNLGWN